LFEAGSDSAFSAGTKRKKREEKWDKTKKKQEGVYALEGVAGRKGGFKL